jgi:pSer/pThr/pTyr-binding forkhead associated (FHA) protein
MFDFFKKNTENSSKDVKTVRESLLRFIKEQLKKAEGGEGANIKGIQLFITCPEEEKQMYEAAVYLDEPGRFKNEEVQKIADDYAIDLPDNWELNIHFSENAPAESKQVPGLDASLFVLTRKNSLQKTASAFIKIRLGEAEKKIYNISSGSGKIFIGREKRVQTADGFYRENTIAFPEKSDNDSNRYISRQHAHIEFDQETGHFILFADEGGVPPRNKVKVRSNNEGEPVKLYSTKVGYELKEGDQILLGQSALVEFSFSPDENEL